MNSTPVAPAPRLCNDVAGLDTLPAGAKLLSTRTGNVWWVRDHRISPRWTGSCGMFSSTRMFLTAEGPLFVIWEPEQ